MERAIINTYSMKTYVLLHFEHKNYVTIIVKRLYRATCFIIYPTNAEKNNAACRSSSQVVKLKHLLQHLLVLQSSG